ncbi:MAG: hypothetical protein WKF82_05085 [Nocardioidaceae bacterium]
MMTNPAEKLLLDGVVRACPDCLGDRIFVSVECEGDHCEFCCTTCGAAVMIDPLFDYRPAIPRVA